MKDQSSLSHRISIQGADPLSLFGHNDANLISLEARYGVRLTARGDTIRVDGPSGSVKAVSALIEEMISCLRRGDDLDAEWQRRLWADEITAEEWDAHEDTPEQARRLEIDTRLADLGLLVNHGLTAGEYSVTPHLYSRSLNELGQVALKEAA